MTPGDHCRSATSLASKPDVWLVTDVPFWERKNGSHQRISQLVNALSKHAKLLLWFLGQRNSAQLENCAKSFPSLQLSGPDFPPSSWSQRPKWHWDGTVRALKNLSFSNKKLSDKRHPDGLGLKLTDFERPEIAKRFVADLRKHRPQAVLFEYVTCSYLAKAMKKEVKPTPYAIVDTHDLLHERQSSFRSRGLEHWLEVTATEEANALESFDSILAIEKSEAAKFAKLNPSQNVICCPFAMPAIELTSAAPARQTKSKSDLQGVVTAGFLAGSGAVNELAIRQFVEQVWSPFFDQRLENGSEQAGIELLIGGRISKQVADLGDSSRAIRIAGEIPDMSSWYREVAFSINPVQAGAGFKIKSLESLAHGVGLISTAEGLKGMESAIGRGAALVEEQEDWAPILQAWFEQPSLRMQMGEAGNGYVRKMHHPDDTIAPLVALLKTVTHARF